MCTDIRLITNPSWNRWLANHTKKKQHTRLRCSYNRNNQFRAQRIQRWMVRSFTSFVDCFFYIQFFALYSLLYTHFSCALYGNEARMQLREEKKHHRLEHWSNAGVNVQLYGLVRCCWVFYFSFSFLYSGGALITMATTPAGRQNIKNCTHTSVHSCALHCTVFCISFLSHNSMATSRRWMFRLF